MPVYSYFTHGVWALQKDTCLSSSFSSQALCCAIMVQNGTIGLHSPVHAHAGPFAGTCFAIDPLLEQGAKPSKKSSAPSSAVSSASENNLAPAVAASLSSSVAADVRQQSDHNAQFFVSLPCWIADSVSRMQTWFKRKTPPAHLDSFFG